MPSLGSLRRVQKHKCDVWWGNTLLASYRYCKTYNIKILRFNENAILAHFNFGGHNDQATDKSISVQEMFCKINVPLYFIPMDQKLPK